MVNVEVLCSNSLGSGVLLALQLEDHYHRTMGAVRHESSTTSQCERGATREAFTRQENGGQAQHRHVDLTTSQHERAADATRDTR